MYHLLYISDGDNFLRPKNFFNTVKQFFYTTLRLMLLPRFRSRLHLKTPRALSDPFKNTRVLNVVKLQLFYKLDTCKAKRLKASPVNPN